MTDYKKWDIVLVPFPFTDLSAFKKRPALIISPDEYNKGNDLVIAFITSNIPEELRYGDVMITNWKISGLPKPSMVRMKFSTIDRKIIAKKIGSIAKEDKLNLSKKILQFFS